MKTSIAAAWLAPALALALAACKGGDDRADATGTPAPASGAAATPTSPATAAKDGAKDGADKDGAGKGGADGAADDAGVRNRLCADFEACRAACAERRPAACLRLTHRAKSEADQKAAGQLVRQLCDAGHGEACFGVYLAGRGKDKKILARSCDMGSGPGCLALAASVKAKDAARAGELRARGMRQLEKSCQHDDSSSCAKIAEEARLGDEADPARARWHGEKACDLGDEDACWAVADQLKSEFPEVAARRMERACELGHADACKAVDARAQTGR